MRLARLFVIALVAACGSDYGAESGNASGGPSGPGPSENLTLDGGNEGVDAGGEEVDDGRRGWQTVGAPIPFAGSAQRPALAVLARGEIALAHGNGDGVEVKRFSGGVWQPIGDRFVTTYPPPLDLAATTTSLFLAWNAADRNHVREWNGTAWSTPGGTPVGASGTFLPHVSLTIAADGRPWLASNEHATSSDPERVFVKGQVDGSSWTDRGTKLGSGTQSALAPDIATNASKTYLVYEGNGVHAYEWSGSGWVELGSGITPPPSAGTFSSPSTSSLAVDGLGRAVVAYHAYLDADNGTLGFVARWSGAQWIHIGGALQALPGKVNNNASFTTMQAVAAAADGTIYVAFTEVDTSGEEGLHVLRCNDTSCAPLGRGRLNPVAGKPATSARMTMDRLSRPVVAWVEGDQVQVWRYHGDPDSGL
jgi:hypothetical protein